MRYNSQWRGWVLGAALGVLPGSGAEGWLRHPDKGGHGRAALRPEDEPVLVRGAVWWFVSG